MPKLRRIELILAELIQAFYDLRAGPAASEESQPKLFRDGRVRKRLDRRKNNPQLALIQGGKSSNDISD